jgi:plasmid replication initiation protein
MLARVSSRIRRRIYGHKTTNLWSFRGYKTTDLWRKTTGFKYVVQCDIVSINQLLGAVVPAKKNELVVKSNRLVEASYRLTLVEQQIVLYSICRSREEQKGLLPDTPVIIDVASFAKLFHIDERNAYHQLKDAMSVLFERKFNFTAIDEATGKLEKGVSRWISEGSYIDGAGQIKVIFSPRVIPFITRLGGEENPFTSYQLEKIGHMTSAHAVRLYELLVQYLSAGTRTVELSWLKETLHLADDYPRLFDLKKRVIDVAVKQINEHSDLRVSYTQRKAGRAVTHLIFDIKSKPEAKPKAKRPVIDDAYLAKYAKPGESRDQAYRRLAEELGQTRLVA